MLAAHIEPQTKWEYALFIIVEEDLFKTYFIDDLFVFLMHDDGINELRIFKVYKIE